MLLQPLVEGAVTIGIGDATHLGEDGLVKQLGVFGHEQKAVLGEQTAVEPLAGAFTQMRSPASGTPAFPEPFTIRQQATTDTVATAGADHAGDWGTASTSANADLVHGTLGARNGIHIIDLQKTVKLFKAATEFLEKTTQRGGHVLFVGANHNFFNTEWRFDDNATGIASCSAGSRVKGGFSKGSSSSAKLARQACSALVSWACSGSSDQRARAGAVQMVSAVGSESCVGETSAASRIKQRAALPRVSGRSHRVKYWSSLASETSSDTTLRWAAMDDDDGRGQRRLGLGGQGGLDLRISPCEFHSDVFCFFRARSNQKQDNSAAMEHVERFVVLTNQLLRDHACPVTPSTMSAVTDWVALRDLIYRVAVRFQQQIEPGHWLWGGSCVPVGGVRRLTPPPEVPAEHWMAQIRALRGPEAEAKAKASRVLWTDAPDLVVGIQTGRDSVCLVVNPFHADWAASDPPTRTRVDQLMAYTWCSLELLAGHPLRLPAALLLQRMTGGQLRQGRGEPAPDHSLSAARCYSPEFRSRFAERFRPDQRFVLFPVGLVPRATPAPAHIPTTLSPGMISQRSPVPVATSR